MVVLFNNQRAVDVPVIGGGIDRLSRPWTSLDPRDRDYHLRANAKPYSVCCLRTQQMESKNHRLILSGVENCTKLAPKNNLLLSSKTIWTGIVVNECDLYFYVQDMQGTRINVYLQPNALSPNEVDAPEEYLRMACVYASDNLDTLRRILYNMCTNDLIDKLNITVENTDGGIMVWKKLSKLLQGQKTSKMLALQATINNTKLVDFTGLNVTR